MNRRDFLKITAAVPAAYALNGYAFTNSENQSIFQNILPIPKELNPVLTDRNGIPTKVFNLEINEGVRSFIDGLPANTYYMGESGIKSSFQYLGPTLRMSDGGNIEINYKNNLKEATTIHGHGMHVPAEMDGTPHQIIYPDQTWTAKYKVNQVACTNWYHPHIMHKTGDHVYKGLSGLIYVDDKETKGLDLPKTYGVDDIPLIIQDKDFKRSGKFVYSPSMRDKMMGYSGEDMLVNGEITPYVEVDPKEIRFRILNGSNARVYNLSIENKVITQIGGDESLLESGVRMDSLKITPAERAEIVIDFTNNKKGVFVLKDLDSGKSIMEIRVKDSSSIEATKTPGQITELERIPLTGNETVHKLTLMGGGMGMMSMGGGNGADMLKIKVDGAEAKSMDMSVIDIKVRKDEVQIWEITNDMPMTHNFHLHGTHFRVIERSVGGKTMPVLEGEKGYKDVVRIDGKGMPPWGKPPHSVKILVKMTDFSDNHTPYMFHCHILEHEDAGMMGQFLVLE